MLGTYNPGELELLNPTCTEALSQLQASKTPEYGLGFRVLLASALSTSY